MKDTRTHETMDTREAFQSALMLLAVNAIGSLLPLIIGFISYQAYSKWQSDWSVFYRNGEFYIYSVSFLTTAGFLFFKNKNKHYDILAWALLLILLTIFFSTTMFALLRVSQDFVVGGLKFSQTILSSTSWTLIIFSIVMLFCSFVLEQKNQTGPNLPEFHKQDQDDLNDAFDKLP